MFLVGQGGGGRTFKEHRDYNRVGDFLFLAVLSLPDFSLCLSSSSAILAPCGAAQIIVDTPIVEFLFFRPLHSATQNEAVTV